MKKTYNKDGSVDLIFNSKEFEDAYIVGCMIHKSEKKVVVRVRGAVKDLRHVVLRKRNELLKSNEIFGIATRELRTNELVTYGKDII